MPTQGQVEPCYERSHRAFVLRARGGDELAFRRLEHLLAGRLWSLARGYFAPGLDADDLYNEGLVGLDQAIKDFDPAKGQPFEAFAFHCSKRAVISAVRAATRRKHEPLNEAGSDLVNVTAPRPGELGAGRQPQPSVPRTVEIRIYLSMIFEVLQKSLSARERRATALSLLGWKRSEIALALTADEKSIENAIRRGREKIEAAVADAGWPPSFATIEEDRSRDTRMAPKRALVAAILSSSSQPMTKQEIAACGGIVVQGLYKLLQRMVRCGEALVDDDGRYSAPIPDAWPEHWRVIAA